MNISWNVLKNIDSNDETKYRVRNEKKGNGMLSTLIIFKVALNDSGSVSCIAQNSHGIANKTIDLTVQDYPVKPRKISADSIRSDSVRIKWKITEPSQINNFIAQCKPSSTSASWEDDSEVRQTTVGSDKSSAIIHGLDSDYIYQCRVYAQNGVGDGPGSELITIRTLQLAPQFAPLSVELKAINSSTVEVKWQSPPKINPNELEPIDGYNIYVKRSADAEFDYVIKVNEVIPGQVHLTHLVHGLLEYVGYEIKVTAFNDAGESPASKTHFVRTKEGVPKQPPREVTCRATSESSIEVRWTTPPFNSLHGILEGYTVQFRKQRNIEIQSVKLSKDMNKVEIQKLDQCSNYSIVVAASTKIGDGVFSNALWCQTLDGLPGPPQSIKASLSSRASVAVSWLPPAKLSCSMTRYTIHIARKYTDLENTVVFRADYGMTMLNITSLQPANVYELWLTASSTQGESKESEKIEKGITDQFPPEIAQISQDIVMPVGETQVLDCSVFGDPLPSRNWKAIYSQENQKDDIEMIRNGSLVINTASEVDSGIYRCIAESPRGIQTIQYVLTVTSPPVCPSLKLIKKDATSITFNVDSTTTFNPVPITDFTLRFKKSGQRSDWNYMHFIEFESITSKLEHLSCGTNYTLQLQCMNEHGYSTSSKQIQISTNGSAPMAPTHSDFIASNGTHHFLRIQTWSDGGCPIEKYEISYKDPITDHWRLYETLYENEKLLLMPNDANKEEYNLDKVLVKAYNNAGKTQVEYDIVKPKTREAEKQVVTPTEKYSKPPFYTNWKIILPIVGAVLIITVVAVSLRLYQVRKRTSRAKAPPATGMRSNAMHFNNERRHPYSDTHGEYLV